MFKKILIANRGEIAQRIADVARTMGVATVAIYSEADAGAPHVKAADEAFCVGPPPVRESYLQIERILEIAAQTGAEAIHPGYGLLSENTAFARAATERGIVFIGPTPEAIDQMGNKAHARQVAQAAGVPVVPGSDGPIESDEQAAQLAERIGYPVLVKASGGGGGIGMQEVRKAEKLVKALASSRDRGQSSFGNAEVYLEKLIVQPRHIEVQVLFDHYGHGVHLFERECSLQRRHQKVVEEAPSPFVSLRPELRAGLTDAALRAARAIGYRNAGTVEFVVSPEGEFYFIEMNTRLQVEHPVTEAITGVDLIGWQLRIAAGEALSLHQEDLQIDGAAVECRLYAEDPERKFMPSPGTLTRFAPPQNHAGVHVDAGYEEGQAVTPFYDPMLAKLIAHGADRGQALDRAAAALRAFELEGIRTNRAWLAELLDTPEVRAGDFDTGWLERRAKGR